MGERELGKRGGAKRGWVAFPLCYRHFLQLIYPGILRGAVAIKFFGITDGSLIYLLLSNVVGFALWICNESLEWLLEVLRSLSEIRVS